MSTTSIRGWFILMLLTPLISKCLNKTKCYMSWGWYFLGEVKNGQWTDARTCNLLETHIHVTVIRWANGCIVS